MSIKNKRGKFVCSFCLKEYVKRFEADQCYESHDIVLVPFAREDLVKLIQFVYLRKDELLTQSLLRTLNRYNRLRAK